MTVAELTWFRIPAVYIPYPFAADDHQKWNALEIADRGGALVSIQDSTSVDDLWKTIAGLLEDDVAIQRMKSSLEEIMPVNPADTIAEIVISTAEEGS